ncbi:beta-N-acetylhexosaminidase [Bacteroides fragilis]
MNKKLLSRLAPGLFAVVLFTACRPAATVKGNLDVIPQPQEIVLARDTTPFIIDRSTTIVYPATNEKMHRTADFLATFIKEMTGTEVRVSDKEKSSNAIILAVDSTMGHPEGYKLQITPEKVLLTGGSEAGVFYGIQTIHKALPILKDGKVAAALPAGTVTDFPRFRYRGFMIDVGHHFFPVSYLKQMIDLMALHNINYFHWHLTEDQGWRIEIKKYPKLTEVGSKRDSTIIDWETKKFDGKPHSGFYTQDEAREIVRYAADRFITVVPEIDLPGHTTAALASYPELGCTGDPYKVLCSFGVFPDVLCAGNDQTLQFTKDVLDEIMDIFPSEYIHIGGDECPKSRWEKCPKCQAKIKELGIKALPKHSKENQLQTYFMSELEKEINAHGRRMLGWDEVLEGGLTPNSTIMSWRGIQGGIEAARQHHDVIMTPIQRLYFSNPRINKMTGFEWMNRVYNFEPVPAELTDAEKKFVIGTQGCIWTEWTADSTKMEWQILPRMAALSEIQWTLPEHKNFERFMERLPEMLKIYSSLDYGYREDVFAADTLKTHK